LLDLAALPERNAGEYDYREAFYRTDQVINARVPSPVRPAAGRRRGQLRRARHQYCTVAGTSARCSGRGHSYLEQYGAARLPGRVKDSTVRAMPMPS
jgi:hypothetical protein